MPMNIKNCGVLLFALLLSSCNEGLNFDLPDPDDEIVIDGWIENGQFAKVLLTKNSPYFGSIDSASIRALVLSRAKVSITDGKDTEVLILRRNDTYFPPYIFEGNKIIGDTGKVYTVIAEYGGKTAWASTTIPPQVKVDTVYFILKDQSDSSGTVYLEFTDPPGTKNYYRILTKRIGKDNRYGSLMIMAIDDNFFSGQRFKLSINMGPKSYLTNGSNENFKLGDSVSIKFCTIDKEHYEFWNSFQDEVLNTGNPFASSIIGVKSNVKGTGLGIWGGYGVSYYTLKIK
jgi:hypothetical protein